MLFAAGYLAACTEVVDSVVDSRYGQYNLSTDWAKNEAILLNIARASKYQPLNFLIYNAYSGSATVSAAASSPGFIIGPNRVASQKQYTFSQGALTANAMANGSISVQNLDTQDFYDALLSPVDYTNLYEFQRQGYPRELLFRLFADYVSLKPGTGDPQGQYSFIVYNDPSEQKSCFGLPQKVIDQLYGSRAQEFQKRVCFNDLVVFALVSGLSSEVRTVTPPSGGNSQTTAEGTPGASQNPNSKTPSTPPKPQIEGRLCFDTALATRAIAEVEHYGLGNLIPKPNDLMATRYHPICGGTGPDDIWLPTSQKSAAAPANAADAARATAAAQAADAAKADAVTKAAAAEAAANAAPSDPAKATAAVAAKAAATDATAKAATADAAAKAKNAPATAAPTSTPGVATLKVQVKSLTGFPVWDIHLLGQHVIEIGTRSTFSMYNFLGKLMREQDAEINKMVDPTNDDSHVPTINQGQPVGCFVGAVLDFGVYCVPIDGAEDTKRTFSILSQLLALKTTTGDLQIQPILRLLPQ